MRPAEDASIMWIPFTKGMAQDLDETMRPADVPLALEDVIQEKQGRWGTRPGFHRITRTIDQGNATDDTTLDNARAIFSTGGPDAELCVVGERSLYAWNERINKLERRGPVSPFALRQEPVFTDEWTYQSQDMAERDGYVLYAAKAKIQSGTAITNFDTALVHMVRTLDGHVVSGQTLSDQTGTATSMYHGVHASSCDGNLLGFALQNINTGSAIALKFWNWPTTTPGNQAWTAVGTISAGVYSLGEDRRTYDVTPLANGGFMVAYVTHTAQRITLVEYNSNLTATGNTYTLTDHAPYRQVAICEDVARGQILCLVEAHDGETGGDVRLYGVDVAGTTTFFDVQLTTLAAAESATDLGVAADQTQAYAACTWVRLITGSAYDNNAQAENQTRSTLTGGAIDTVEVSYNARWITQPWWRKGRAYCAAATIVGVNTLDTSKTLGAHFDIFGVDPDVSPWDVHYVVDLRANDAESDETRPPHLVGIWDVGTAPANPTKRGSANHPCPIPAYTKGPPGALIGDAGTMREARWLDDDLDAVAVRFVAESNAVNLRDSVPSFATLEIALDYSAPVTTARVHGGAVAIGGGIVSWYDGQQACELNHAIAPVPYDLTAATTGGSLADGDYQMIGVWSYTDARNFVHRSLPSPPSEETLSGGSGNGTLTVSARTNPATNRRNYGDTVVQWYRGDDDGNYSQVSPPTRVLPNIDTAFDTEDFIDTDLFPKSRLLYTQSGELEAVIPEATRIVATIGRRLWGGDCARWFRVIYSKPTDAGLAGAYGLAPEFNEAFALQVPGDREVTALGALDDKAVIWTRESTYLVAGRGPLDNGLENDFSELSLVNGNVGCIEARSVVEVPSEDGVFPGGVFFQSDAGIYLLTRGLALTFIGGGVEDDLAAHPVITSASHDKARRLVLFTATNADRTSGVVLVFDYEAGAWIRWQPRKGQGERVVPVGGCMHRGRFYMVEESGQLWQQQKAGEPWAYYDDGWTWVQAAIETADVFGGQPGGWHRLARFVPVVERYEKGGATVGLRVTTITDGESADSREISANMVDSWEGQKVPIEVRPARHKCHSMRLRLESVEGEGAASGRGLAFSGVLVHTRPRRTPARVSSNQRT